MPEARSPYVESEESQYERWPHPAPCHDLTALPLTSPVLAYQDLRSLFWLFWPNRAVDEDLDILVAGCGSVQGAAQALVYPRARVVAIDISRTCLEHTESLQRKHGLTNLTVRQLRLEDVASLNASFDYIIGHDVLHCLADPAAGLRALGQALRQDGVIDVMVHGRVGRSGVTMLQDLFRVMGVHQDAAGVRTVRDVLVSLPPTHPVQPYRRLAAQDLAGDEGLVDTFLSRRNRPYTAGECLDLVNDAGLMFQGWKENALYYAETRIPAGDRMWPHLNALTDRQLWETVEILDATILAHRFHVCRTDRAPETWKIHFEDDAFLDYVPVARISQSVAASRLRRQPAFIARPPFPALPLDERQAATFNQIDGVRTVRACLAAAGLPTETAANTAWGRYFFRSLWRAGYALFRLP